MASGVAAVFSVAVARATTAAHATASPTDTRSCCCLLRTAPPLLRRRHCWSVRSETQRPLRLRHFTWRARPATKAPTHFLHPLPAPRRPPNNISTRVPGPYHGKEPFDPGAGGGACGAAASEALPERGSRRHGVEPSVSAADGDL
eukprot:365554-Chlamydomonas_euryale.AAC.29